MVNELMRLAGVDPDNETDREKRIRLRAQQEVLPPLPGIEQPPIRPAENALELIAERQRPELGEFGIPIVAPDAPDAPEVAETVGGGTPIDDVISLLEKTEGDSMRDFSEKQRDAAARAAESLRQKNDARKVLREEAAKKNPSPSKLERALVVLTGGISGHLGTFDKAQRSRDARAAVDKSFEAEWERTQDAAETAKAAAVRASVLAGTQSYNAAKAHLEGLAMSGGGSIPEDFLNKFGAIEARNLMTEFEGFKHNWTTADADKRRILYLDALERHAPLSLYETYLPMPLPPPGIGVTLEDATLVWEAYIGGKKAEHKGKEFERTIVKDEAGSEFYNDIEVRMAQLHGVDIIDEKMELIAGPTIDAITTQAQGIDKIKELDEAVGNQAYLAWLGDEKTPMMSPEKKRAIQSFIKSDSWTDQAGLAKMMRDLKLEEPTLDAIEKNASRITGLRDALAKEQEGTPEYEKAEEALEIGLALSSSGYVITTEEDEDGKIVFKAERTGKKDPYTLVMSPGATGGYVIGAKLNADIIRRGDPEEIKKAQELADKAAELMHQTTRSTLYLADRKVRKERTKAEIQKEFNEYMKGLENEGKRDLVKAVMRKQDRDEGMSGEEIKLLRELIKRGFID